LRLKKVVVGASGEYVVQGEIMRSRQHI